MTCFRASAIPSGTVLSFGGVAALLLAVAGCGDATGPAQLRPGEWPRGVLVFTAFDGGIDLDVYASNANGGALARLTSTTESEYAPSWTSDGRRIRFFRFGESGYQAYEMNADGSGVELRSAPINTPTGPRVSPDGRRIAYSKALPLGGAPGSTKTGEGLFIADLDGSGEAMVAEIACDAQCWYVEDPRWSPDGRRLAFTATQAGGGESASALYVVNVDGTGRLQLDREVRGTSVADPAWSPDGQRLAFSVLTSHGYMGVVRGDLYVISADGSGRKAITAQPTRDSDMVVSRGAVWSPSGNWLAYLYSRNLDPTALYVIRADGSEQGRVPTSPTLSVHSVDWNPVLTSR